jgi:hypothetical protein
MLNQDLFATKSGVMSVDTTFGLCMFLQVVDMPKERVHGHALSILFGYTVIEA